MEGWTPTTRPPPQPPTPYRLRPRPYANALAVLGARHMPPQSTLIRGMALRRRRSCSQIYTQCPATPQNNSPQTLRIDHKLSYVSRCSLGVCAERGSAGMTFVVSRGECTVPPLCVQNAHGKFKNAEKSRQLFLTPPPPTLASCPPPPTDAAGVGIQHCTQTPARFGSYK